MRFSRRWSLAILISGATALAWLLLRSGSKPSRFVYPCQQAAFSTASLAFGAPLVAALIAARRRLGKSLLTPRGLIVLALVASATVGGWSLVSRIDVFAAPLLSPPADYRAQVFHVAGIAQDPVGDHFPGLDDLIEIMGGHGLKLYASDAESLVAGPGGIVGADDVVLVKINYQWEERGGTNTDLLRGLLRRIVDHPDGFTGEVVVVENAQFRSTEGFDRTANNAQVTSQSPYDVVQDFRSEGWTVSLFDWTPTRYTSVSEYSEGDETDGYVVYPFDWNLFGAVSYPKFRTEHGTRISLKHGLWDGVQYDRSRLKVINIPVLKSHSSTYGATVSVKNWMGVVTRELGTYSHTAIRLGILGEVMAETAPADLNLIDAVWINADPNTGPATPYAGATRRDELVASVDPVAADMWAVKNILIPAFEGNGHSPPWPTPSADPDDPNSAFREYLDNSMSRLLDAGHTVTNDLTKIDALEDAPPGEASDPAGTGPAFTVAKDPGGYALAWSSPVRGGPVLDYNLYRTPLGSGRDRTAPECEAFLGAGTSAVVADLADNHGFLVVARNAVAEGILGRDSLGRDRPSGGAANACP